MIETLAQLNAAAYRAPLIAVDVDGTLADFSHRLHLLEGRSPHCLADAPRETILRFMEAEQVARDKPIREGCSWTRAWSRERNMRFLTSRWESLRDCTRQWIVSNCHWFGCNGDMRPDHWTHLTTPTVKGIYARWYPEHTLVIDDDEQVLAFLASEFQHLKLAKAPECFMP